MKHRDIFNVPARIEHRTRVKRAWKDENGQSMSETESLGWFTILTFGGNEFAFYHGESRPGTLKGVAKVTIEFETIEPTNAE